MTCDLPLSLESCKDQVKASGLDTASAHQTRVCTRVSGSCHLSAGHWAKALPDVWPDEQG